MNVRLLILGVLHRAPMHGYEIQRVFEQSRVDRWAGVLKGSIYHALKKMAAEGLLEVEAESQAGAGVKSIYRITNSGRRELKSLAKKAWQAPIDPFPTSLYAALAIWDVLPPEEVRPLAEAQIERLEAEIASWKSAERARASAGALPEHARLVFDSARQHLEVELRLLHALRLLTSRS